MQRQGPLKASGLWTLWNTAAGTFWRAARRYLRLRHEDVIANRGERRPDRAFVGEDVAGSPFVSNTEVQLTLSHSVAGNPSRFTTGLRRARPATSGRRRCDGLTARW
jgi:hypothetical protein